MNTVLFNIQWMTVNILLACIPAAISFILLHKVPKWLRVILWVAWILFLPNTIYTVTDIQYSFKQIAENSFLPQILLVIEYACLMSAGVITYFYSLKPFEKALHKHKIKGNAKIFAFILLNFIISFAVVLGKVARTESWYIVTDTSRVFRDIIQILSSVPLMLLVLVLGLLFNGIYFGVKTFNLQKTIYKKE